MKLPHYLIILLLVIILVSGICLLLFDLSLGHYFFSIGADDGLVSLRKFYPRMCQLSKQDLNSVYNNYTTAKFQKKFNHDYFSNTLAASNMFCGGTSELKKLGANLYLNDNINGALDYGLEFSFYTNNNKIRVDLTFIKDTNAIKIDDVELIFL